jgi:hypothetical protein
MCVTSLTAVDSMDGPMPRSTPSKEGASWPSERYLTGGEGPCYVVLCGAVWCGVLLSYYYVLWCGEKDGTQQAARPRVRGGGCGRRGGSAPPCSSSDLHIIKAISVSE